MSEPMAVAPLALEGRAVRLEPLSLDHLPGLIAIGLDEDLWRWTNAVITTPEQLRAYVETALDEQARGVSLPFATVELAGGAVAGCTRYGNIDRRNRRVEIGWTWVGRPWQRSVVNTEAKYLMLRHAFETLGCIRVELKTDALNERSRRAIGRIGGQEEGTLRRHMITDSGRVRDTVYFSILDSEWPAAKANLERMLAREE
ncbi:MAG TPA: GNAT family protein [Herpetosiphonaceae bacterium]